MTTDNGCPWCGCELTFRAVDGTPICSGCNHVRRRAPLPAPVDEAEEAEVARGRRAGKFCPPYGQPRDSFVEAVVESMRKTHDGGPKVVAPGR